MIQHHYRTRNAQALYEMHYGPNMTPMVDVVMVILIFFMASAAMLGPEWFVRTNLPRAAAVSAPTSDAPPLRLTLAMTRDEGSTQYHLNGQEQALEAAQVFEALESAVRARSPGEIVVIVNPAPAVPYEDVVALHAACQRLGISKVGLGEPEKPAKDAGP